MGVIFLGLFGEEPEKFKLICPKCGSENTEIGTYRYDTIYCTCLDCRYSDLPYESEYDYESRMEG